MPSRLTDRFAAAVKRTASVWQAQSAIASGSALALLLATCCATNAMLAAPDGVHHLVMMLAIALAATISSIAGFAFGAIGGAFLFRLHDDQASVVQILIICSIANQASMNWAMRRNIDCRELTLYLAGGIIGLPIGVWILTTMNRAIYTHALGAFLVAYGAILLFQKPIVLRGRHRLIDTLVGFFGGVTGGAAGFPSAAISIWCGTKGWDKAHQRAVVQPFILIMQILALPMISVARHSTAGGVSLDPLNLLFIPGSLVGTMIGMALFRRMSDRQFARAVNILLIASGIGFAA